MANERKFDPTKPVTTRDGRKARIICTDAVGAYPIIALIPNKEGDEYSLGYTKTGMYLNEPRECGHDLVNVKFKNKGWVNIYPTKSEIYKAVGRPSSFIYETQRDADRNATVERIACVEIEWEE